MTIKHLSDADFLLSVLRDGEWHELNQILDESKAARGHGLTVHSRAASLREKGHTILTMQKRNRAGRIDSFYKLVALDEAAASRVEEVSSPSSLAGGPPGGVAASSNAKQLTWFDQPYACSVDESAGVAT